jgi:hypothetical protein
MIGGRKPQNLWYGLPSINLPYYDNALEPNFSEQLSTVDTAWFKSDNWPQKLTASTFNEDAKRLGYDNIKMYHTVINTSSGNTDFYNSKNIDRFIGPTGIIQNNKYKVDARISDTETVEIPAPYYGNWSGSHAHSHKTSELKILDQGKNPTKEAYIVLNGVNRFSKRNGFYFNTIQPYQHHTNCPAPGINVYSFSFDPEDHQPSGSCNFSRIDSGSIVVTFETDYVKIYTSTMKSYALCYNILRIMSGQGQLAYSG